MKKLFIGMIILSLSIPAIGLAQLDSVYHQGPSQGSQPNGAIQSTDNFPSGPMIILQGELREIPPFDTRIESEPSIIEFDASILPEYVYIEDPSAGENPQVGANGVGVLLDKFTGFTATNAIPPDPSLAVGPNHIIATVNGFPSFFRIFDKSGNIIKTIPVSTWFSPVSPDESGDGQVIYDHFAGRWIISYMQVNETNQTAANLIAVSDDDDPIGTWYVYRFDTKKHGSIQTNTWGDYPQIGFDDEAIYLATRIFGFAGGWFGTKMRVIRKSELYGANGGSVTWWDFWDIRQPNVIPTAGLRLDNIHPTFSYTTGQSGYLFYSHDNQANWYVLYKFINPTANPPRLRGKQIPSATYYVTPNANQLGGGQALESGGSVTRTSPIVRDGKMYIAHSTGNTISPTQGASAKYAIVDLNTPAVVEEAELGAVGYYYIFPTLTVDENHNIGMTFTRSATTEYPGAFYSTKSAGDPPGLSPSAPAQVGLGNYQQVASGRNRWGDYFAIGLDPANNHEIFFHTEYANTGNSWATVIGRIIAAPYSGVKTYVYPDNYDFKEVEIGATSLNGEIILANYGDADLVITNIPSTFDDFNLASSLSFPITVASYDSVTLEFNYTPTSAGSVNVIYPVTSNDPGLSGINLSGSGYDLTLVTEKTFYASSGIQNSGNILTIDPTTGAGSIIGLSLFNEVTSLSINPIDGRMYGLVAGAGSADLVKINAAAGDAHLLSTMSIPLMAGIAFDTTGTLYGVTRVGEIYIIDPSTGSTTLVVDAVASYLGVTFHPQTNELWATSRAVAPPNNDLVFKVNLSTGDTTFVGHTGLGKQTNAISFDENLNLFGVTGSSAELNNFVSINTSTGEGTIIGSIGYQHILGLAFLDEILTSVEDDNNANIPSSFTLKQNYPNPFNPTTRIEFSLPVESDVKVMIYNLLGQEVARVVDGQMQAGNHSVVWNAGSQSDNIITSGIYFYKLSAIGVNGNEFQEIKKMVLLK
jgi:hypothetical protein